MKRSVTLRFDERPVGRGIVWCQPCEGLIYPGKLKPGYLVSAKCCGVNVLLEILEVKTCQSIEARVVNIDQKIGDVAAVFDAGRVVRLSRDHIFTCEVPAPPLQSHQKAHTVLLQTQEIKLYDLN